MNEKDTSSEFRMKETFFIGDVDTLKVLADSYRLRMIEAISKDHITAKEWAERLGDKVHKLYYHIKLFEKHGIVVVVSERIVSGIVEKTYALVAENFEMKPGLVSSMQDDHATLLQLLQSVLDATSADLKAALASGAAELNDEQNAMIFRSHLKITKERAEVISKKIKELLEDEDSDDESAISYGITIVFHPLAESEWEHKREKEGDTP